MLYDENNIFDNCRFVADVMKTRQDLHFQALRLIHYVIYRVISDNKNLQTYTGSVMELAEAFHIKRSNIYRDIDSLSDQLHSTGMIIGHKDPRKSWQTVTWLSRSYYNGRGTILIKLSYSMIAYVKGIRFMFPEDYHLTILKFNSVYANERIGLHPSEEMFETQVRNYQFRFLRKMLGAKIDFVTEEIVEDANTVVGNRERAMERMRANFTPQRGRERARYVKGDVILSRVLRVSDNALVVEASGYEVAMTVRQVTPMAVVLPEIFKPGDNFPVTVTGVSDTGISLIGAQGARINIFQKVHEYRYGSVVLAEVIHIYRGVYHLKMPNGCRGAMFFNKALLRTRVKEGDMVTAIVIGFSENDDAVKCSLR